MDKYLDIVTSMERIPLPSHATHSQRACVSDGARASEKRNKKYLCDKERMFCNLFGSLQKNIGK